MNTTHLNHDGAGRWLALIIFTVPAISAVPGVGAFHHPALPQGCKTHAAFWAGRDFETPRGTMGGSRLGDRDCGIVVPEDRHQAPKGHGRDQCEERREDLPSSNPSLVIKTAMRNPDVSTKIWRLRLFIACRRHIHAGHPLSVVLTDWLWIRRRWGWAAARCHAGLFTQYLDYPCPGPSSRHWAK